MPPSGSPPTIADAVRSTRQRTLATGEAELAIDLHPAAPPLRITASDDRAGRSAHGDTALAGPGYHRFVGRVLERLGAEVGIEWTDGDGALTFADRPAAERAYLALARPATRAGPGRGPPRRAPASTSGLPGGHALH